MKHMLIFIVSNSKHCFVNIDSGDVFPLQSEARYSVQEREELSKVFDDKDFFPGKEYILAPRDTKINILWKSTEVSNYDIIIKNLSLKPLKYV